MVLNQQCSPSTLTPKIRKKRPSRLHTEQQRNQNSSLLRGLRRNTVTQLTHGVFSLGEGHPPRDRAHLQSRMFSKLRADVFFWRRKQEPGGLWLLSRALGRWRKEVRHPGHIRTIIQALKKSAILIPPSAEQQQHSASPEFTAWEPLQLSHGAFSACAGLCLVSLLLTYRTCI